MFKKLLKEPLLHFVIIGSLLFMVYSIMNQNNPGENEIEVSTQDIDNMVYTWMQKWNRAPSKEELNSLVTGYIEEEVLSREAKALGLDQGDNIVKRRLAQKMQFIMEEGDPVRTASEDELKKYFEEKKDRYKSKPLYSFCQITIADNREAGMERAHQLEKALHNKSDTSGVKHLGYPTLIPFDIDSNSAVEIDRQFGKGFSEQLNEIRLNSWAGPLQSGLGTHFIYVYQKQEGSYPEFSEVISRVEQDWEDEQRQRIKDRKLEELIAKYKVRSELDKWLEEASTSK